MRVGRDISVEEIRRAYDAVCITIGARKQRDLRIEGRDLDGIYQATDFLEQQNRIVQRRFDPGGGFAVGVVPPGGRHRRRRYRLRLHRDGQPAGRAFASPRSKFCPRRR